MGKKRRNFTPEFKFQVVMECLTGQRRRVDILREHQLSDSTVSRWIERFQEHGPEVFAASNQSALSERDRRIAELERAVGRLTMELQAAKKASTWLNSRS
jgi:transposase-like protein